MRTRSSESFRRLYGASPWHLLGATACFAVVAIAVTGWFEEPPSSLKYILVWFVGAILAHDLLLLPLYATLDRLASAGSRRARAHPAHRRRPHGWVYLRVPVLLSGLILLVFWAEILRRGDATFEIASGQHQHVYLVRYLIIVAVLFGASGASYLVAALRNRRTAPVEPVQDD